MDVLRSYFFTRSLMRSPTLFFLSVRVFGLLGFFHNVSAAVSSGFLKVSSVYLGIEMIQGTPEEGRRIQLPKRCEKKSQKVEDNCPKTLTNKNHQAPFQKF